MIYCDSSFLLPLYLYEVDFSEKAGEIAAAWTEAPWISPIADLEFTNAVCRKIFEKEISSSAGNVALKHFKNDVAANFFAWGSCNLAVMFRDAAKLSLRHTSDGGHRSLDILHVAAAKLLGANRFLSFDLRLNRLAEAAGMKLIR